MFNKGINLVYIKEPHINTDVYRTKLNHQIEKIKTDTGSKATDKLIDAIFTALWDYTIDLAREQIEIAFKQSQAEVEYLHKRTSEGVVEAQRRFAKEEIEGKPHKKNLQGRPVGYKYVHKDEAGKEGADPEIQQVL